MDQGCVCLRLLRGAWDAQAGIGVLVIVAVVKFKGLARVIFRLGGGAWASGKQRISYGSLRRTGGSHQTGRSSDQHCPAALLDSVQSSSDRGRRERG